MYKYPKIKVYNKNKELIAVFSKPNGVFSEKKKKNTLVAPTQNIVLNSESTLTFQMLKTSNKWQEVKDPENEWHCNGKVYIATQTGSFSYEGDVVNVTLVEKWYELSKQYGQIHNVDTTVEALDEHSIVILPKTEEQFKLTVNGTKYNDSDIKDSRGVLQPKGSAGYALWGILKANKSGWTLGVCDVIADGFDASKDYGVFNLETDMKDLLNAIKSVQTLWGGILVWDSANKIVHLRDETKVGTDFNTWKGFEVREGKNLASKPVITVDNNLITRAYILGNGNLNIKAVNNDKTYIDNFEYTNKIYEGYLQNPNIHYTGSEDKSGQKQLLEWGKRELSKMCKPREQAEFNIFDRSGEQAFSHEKFDIGDIIKVVYTDADNKTITKEQRITSVTNAVWDKSDCALVVGDKILNNREIFNLTYKNSIVDNPKFDWNGDFNGVDITIDIPDELTSFFGGFSASLSNVTYLQARKSTENTEAIAEVRVYADETFASVESFTAFQSWTEDSFTQSTTTINQISDRLSAQIDLEATHYQENKDYTTNSVADLKLYVNGDFSQATLNAAYKYTNSKTGEVSSSLAEFEAYASNNYATVGMLAQTDNALAGIKATADEANAQVVIQAQKLGNIDNRGGYLIVDDSYVKISYVNAGQLLIGTNGSTYLGATGTLSLVGAGQIRMSYGTLYLNNQAVTWGGLGNNYLVKA